MKLKTEVDLSLLKRRETQLAILKQVDKTHQKVTEAEQDLADRRQELRKLVVLAHVGSEIPVQELAEVCDLHVTTIYGWVKAEIHHFREKQQQNGDMAP